MRTLSGPRRPLVLITVAVLGLSSCVSQERTSDGDGVALARLAASDLGQVVEGLHQLLVGLTQVAEMTGDDPSPCDELAASIVEEDDALAGFVGRVREDGVLDCGSAPREGTVRSDDRLWFKRAVETKAFSVGEYQVGRVTGDATIVFAQPVLDDDDVSSVLLASIDLEALGRRASEIPLPQDATLTILDQAGTVLARPDAGDGVIGEKPEPFAEVVTDNPDPGDVGTLEDVDGEEREFALATVDGLPDDQNLYVLVGVSS